MILEAFSKYLHESDPDLSSMEVLARWLWEKLSMPPQCNVDQVIQCEIIICRQEPNDGDPVFCELFTPQPENTSDLVDSTFVFRGNSKSGERLLNSLREYGQSYEQQKWARWIHNLKASDFSPSDARRRIDDQCD